MKINRLLTLVATLVVATTALHALTLEECVLGGRSPLNAGTMQPASGGVFYRLSNDGLTIDKIGYRDGRTSTLLDTRSSGLGPWDDFAVTSDARYALLWNDEKPIYRYSFSANYYMADLRTGTITPIGDGGEEIATLSPTGTHAAYVKDNNIYITDLRNRTTVQVTHDGKKNEIINGVPDWVYQEEIGMLNSLRWSPDGTRLAFIRWDESKVPMESMIIYEGTCNPNTEYALHPGRQDFKYPVAGEPNSVVSVHCYDLGAHQLQAVPLPLETDDYVNHIDFAPTGKLMVQRLNRTQNDLHIYAVDCAAMSVAELYREQSTTWVDTKMSNQVCYCNDFFIIPSERSGFMQLYQYDYSGKLLRQLTDDDNCIVSDFYGYDARRKRCLYQSSCGPLNRVIAAVDLQGRVTRLAPSTSDGHGTASAVMSTDFDYYVGRYSDAATPDRYSVYDARGRRVRDIELNESYTQRYTAVDVPRREFITIEHAGYQLNGYIIKPVDFDPTRRYPVIMEHYNGPGSQEVRDKWEINWEQYFASQGYIIVNVDCRGTGFRGKEFESLTYLRLGKLETEDAVAAANYMATLPWVDADRIGIMGWSYGGFQTLMAMSEPGSHYACGVSIAPVTTWRFYDSIYTERYMRTPQENPEGYSNFPLNRVDSLKGRVLIMFGSADDNVHIINSMQYVAELTQRGRTCDMMVFTNQNHSIRDCDSRAVVYKRALEFYNQYLKGE